MTLLKSAFHDGQNMRGSMLRHQHVLRDLLADDSVLNELVAFNMNGGGRRMEDGLRSMSMVCFPLSTKFNTSFLVMRPFKTCALNLR